MPRRASASAVWFARSEHALGIFLTRCFLKSPDQSDLSLTALRHLRCLIELSETREKSTVYWIASMTDCCCFNHYTLLGAGYWCSIGDYLLCVFVVCAFMVMFCCFVVDVLCAIQPKEDNAADSVLYHQSAPGLRYRSFTLRENYVRPALFTSCPQKPGESSPASNPHGFSAGCPVCSLAYLLRFTTEKRSARPASSNPKTK